MEEEEKMKTVSREMEDTTFRLILFDLEGSTSCHFTPPPHFSPLMHVPGYLHFHNPVKEIFFRESLSV